MARHTVAIDMDGVLASWEGGTHDIPGPPIPGSVEFTKQVSKFADIVIHTCRCTPALYRCFGGRTAPHLLENGVREWLDRHGFAYDAIWTDNGKPAATLYVDDRGYRLRPNESFNPTEEAASIEAVLLGESRVTEDAQ